MDTTEHNMCCHCPKSNFIISLILDNSRYLRGWCQYEADKAVKWQRDHSHKGLPLVVSAQSNREVFRWTCHPHPHTPHCYKQTQEFLLEKHLPVSLAVIMRSYHSVCTVVLTALTHQSLSGLSLGGGLWPGLLSQSLNSKCYDYTQTANHFH